MRTSLFIELLDDLLPMYKGHHRDSQGGIELSLVDLSAYDLSGTSQHFVRTVPFEERLLVAYSIHNDPRFWFTTRLLLGFDLGFIAMSQNMSKKTAKQLADSEILTLKTIKY